MQWWYCFCFSNEKTEAELQDFALNHKADLFLKESRDKHLLVARTPPQPTPGPLIPSTRKISPSSGPSGLPRPCRAAHSLPPSGGGGVSTLLSLIERFWA